jgi:hypothetical protein
MQKVVGSSPISRFKRPANRHLSVVDAVRWTCADALAVDEAPDPATLRELGEDLADHVRLEERELFGLIEAALPASRLAAVAAALEHAEP